MELNQTAIILGIVFTISLSLFAINSIEAATPFFVNDAFTKNGVEWCEENQQLYQILGNKFFDHHKHSIESRICVSLYNDPLWTYDGPDKYEKLIEKSRYYVALEIAESVEEAKTGVVDPTPATVPETEMQVETEKESETKIEDEWVEITIPVDEVKIETTTNQESGGGCLIATAAYGSELSPQVQLLREIRDNKVLSTESGSSFMESFNTFYYSFSPTVADWERENPMFKEAVKLGITPLLVSLSMLNHVDIDSEQEMLGYGIGIILMNVGMYFVVPAMVIHRIKNR